MLLAKLLRNNRTRCQRLIVATPKYNLLHIIRFKVAIISLFCQVP